MDKIDGIELIGCVSRLKIYSARTAGCKTFSIAPLIDSLLSTYITYTLEIKKFLNDTFSYI